MTFTAQPVGAVARSQQGVPMTKNGIGAMGRGGLSRGDGIGSVPGHSSYSLRGRT